MCLCVDYRELNKKTLHDRYPLARVLEMISKLAGMKWFTTLDFKKVCHHGKMSPESLYKTALILPMGIYECREMPFGFKNAPVSCISAFNGDLPPWTKNEICSPYLDHKILERY